MYFVLPSFGNDHDYIRNVAWGRCVSFYSIIIMCGLVAQWSVRCNAFRCHQVFVFDFIATFVVYGCAVCHSTVSNLYGPFASISTQLVVNAGLVWMLAGSANPLPQVISLTTCCDRNQRELLAWRIGANMLAGLISHPFSKMLWTQLNHDISSKIMERYHCSPCSSIPFGFGVEFAGTLVACGVFASSTYCSHFEVYELAIKLIIGSFIQTLGAPTQTIHLNPALAGSRLFGCGFQPEIMNGLVVHGFGPLAAAIMYTQYCTSQLMACTECPMPMPCVTPCAPCGTEACNLTQSCSFNRSPALPFCSSPAANSGPCSPASCDKITAQVKQSKDEDGKRKVDYVVYFPPMCTEKGIRLRHKFVIDKDEEDEEADQHKSGKKSSAAKGSDNKTKEKKPGEKASPKDTKKSDAKAGDEKHKDPHKSANDHADKKHLPTSSNNNQNSRHRRPRDSSR